MKTIIALALLAVAGGAVDVDVYIDASRGVPGLLVADTLDSMSHGSYTGQINNSAWISTTKVTKIPGLINLNGTLLQPDSVHSIAIRNQNESNNVELWYGSSEASPWPPNHDSISIGFAFNTTALTPAYSGQIDLVVGSCYPSGFYVWQVSYEQATKPTMRCHGDTNGTTTFSPSDIDIDTSHWYWVTGKYRKGMIFLSVFDMQNNYAQIDTMVTCTTTINPARSRIRFGRCTAGHGGLTLNPDSMYFQSLMIDYTDATFPLLPDTATYLHKHYVSPSGTGTWEEALNAETPCNITTMNVSVSAGDTAYITEGTYSGTGVAPASSGTYDNPITIIGIGSPRITGAAYGLQLDSISHCKISGVRFVLNDRHVRVWHHSDSNLIYNCVFDSCADTSIYDVGNCYYHSRYNRFVKCTFGRAGYSLGNNVGNLFGLGRYSVYDSTKYNLIDSCEFYLGGHSVLFCFGQFNVIQNCYLHNDSVPGTADSIYGYRCFLMQGDSVEFNVIQNNVVAFSYSSASLMSIRSGKNIFRRNTFFRGGAGFQIANADPSEPCDPADSNRIYHNSFFGNGRGTTGNFIGPVYFADWGYGDPKGNIVKLNIFYGNNSDNVTYDGVANDVNTVVPNWTDDPKYSDTTQTNQFSGTPSLTLQSSSLARDSAGYLTIITSATGSGTSFIVEDAKYFSAGCNVVSGDSLRIQGNNAVIVISAIDYATNEITFAPSISWSQNDSLTIKFYGTKPDWGANEGYYLYDNPHFGRIKLPEISGNLVPLQYGDWCSPCSSYLIVNDVVVDSAKGNSTEYDTLTNGFGTIADVIIKTIKE